ncbi:MAG: hypothetical protein WCH05_00250 [Chlorobiaceae bacterium]
MKKKIIPLLTVFGVYLLLALLLFWPLVFQSNTLIAPDSLIPHASTLALERLQAQTGSYPLWQPWLFSGMPTVEAFSYISELYLPNVVFTLFHTDAVVLQLLHLAFAGLGVFLFLRHYGLNAFVAGFGGAIFMLNPYMTAMLVHGHGSQLMTAAYMPWMLWAAMRVIERGGLADAGVLAIIAGFQLQRAHVQIAWYSWLLMLLLLLALFISRRDSLKTNLHRSGLLLLALSCALAMSAAIYLPASEYAHYSVRGMAAGGGASAWEYATLWSMHPMELLTFLVPGFFGFGGESYWGFMPFTDFPNYAGIVVLMLALLGAYMRRKEPMTRFFAVAALLAILLSFGRFFTPVFDLFYHYVPLFSSFRVPSMALIMLYLVIAFLAAAGVSDLLQLPPERLRRPVLFGAILLGAVSILFLVSAQPVESVFRSLFPEPATERFDLAFMVNTVRWESLAGSLLTVLAIALLFTLILWLSMKGRLSENMTGTLLFLLALGDLFWMDLQIIRPSSASLRSPVFADSRQVERAFQPDDITAYLSSVKGPFRVYPAGPLFSENKFALFGIESAGGYHPAKLRLYEEFLSKTSSLSSLNVLRMLNVAYVITPEPIEHPGLLPVKRGVLQLAAGPVDVWVYQLKGARPRAWFAERVVGLEGDGELFGRLLDDRAPAGEAYVESSVWRGTRSFSPATITALEAAPESMRLKVTAPKEAFLVVSELYYPLRWKVKVDGREATMVKVNGVIRGVTLPRGSREVIFTYDRSAFEKGRMISLGAFALALMLAAGGVAFGRSGKQPL